jgi:hypothetical protein
MPRVNRGENYANYIHGTAKQKRAKRKEGERELPARLLSGWGKIEFSIYCRCFDSYCRFVLVCGFQFWDLRKTFP